MDKLDIAKKIISEFFEKEYGDVNTDDFSDLEKIGVAYTTTEDEKHEIQAIVDLIHYEQKLYCDEHLVNTEKYQNLDDMIECCLKCLDFDSLVLIPETVEAFIDIMSMLEGTGWVVISDSFCEDANGKYFIEIENSSPLGEDLVESIWFDGTVEGFVQSVREHADNYDAEEHAALYIGMRGKQGIPHSIRDLMDDADAIGEMLKDLAATLEYQDHLMSDATSQKDDEKTEMLGRLIDVVEDWLTEKGFTPKDFPNKYREGEADEAIIFGADYDRLANDFAVALGF